MAATTRIDFDSELLAKLRARRPGKDDRTLLEELARIELGFETLGEIQRRTGPQCKCGAFAVSAASVCRRHERACAVGGEALVAST